MWHLCGTCCLSKSRTDFVGRVLLACLVLVMGVDAERHIYRCMPREVLNFFDVQPAFKKPCDVGVPLRYNYDKPEKPRISRVFGYLARFFILFQTEKSSREVVIS